MKKITQPIDLPKNKDKGWLKRVTKAISEKDLHTLGILAKELESLTTKEKERFIDDELWEKTLDEVKKQAIEKNKIDSYKQYLKFTKISYYRTKAQSEIDVLQYIIDERVAWKQVNNEHTKFVYEEYIKYFPKSDNVSEVKSKLKELIKSENKIYQAKLLINEQEAWKKALRLNSKNSYTVYLSSYPNNLHTDEAKEKKEIIVQKEEELLAKEYLVLEEKNAWDRAIRLDSQNSYTEYLNGFPQHKNTQNAKIRLDELIAIKKEKVFWKEIKEQDTIKSYQKYIEIYPQGLYTDKAQSFLDDFLAIAKKQQQDKEAWNDAQLENTVEGYEKYLSYYSSGKYTNNASDSIRLLIDKDLKELMVWANKNNIHPDELPRDIDKLRKITRLHVSNKSLHNLPKEILSLRNLEILNISNNKFKEFPIWLTTLTTLKNLNFSSNLLNKIPSEISNLDKLEHLNLSSNLLELLPSEICYLTRLQYFDISKNKIIFLPTNIGDLSSLKYFSIENISLYLRELPKSIWQLNNLDANSLNHLNRLVKSIINYELSVWNESLVKNELASYELYLEMFKNGKYIKRAKEKLNELIQEENMWKEAEEIKSYFPYIEKYPEGKYINEANTKREQQFWDSALVRNNVYKYEDYLKWYPSGKYSDEAHVKIQKINSNKLFKIFMIIALIVLIILISTGWWQPILEFIFSIFILGGILLVLGYLFR